MIMHEMDRGIKRTPDLFPFALVVLSTATVLTWPLAPNALFGAWKVAQAAWGRGVGFGTLGCSFIVLAVTCFLLSTEEQTVYKRRALFCAAMIAAGLAALCAVAGYMLAMGAGR